MAIGSPALAICVPISSSRSRLSCDSQGLTLHAVLPDEVATGGAASGEDRPGRTTSRFSTTLVPLCLHIDAANMSITQGFTLTYKRPQQTKTEGKRIKSGQRSARVGVRRRHRVLPLNREQPQITASNSNVVRNSLKTWAAPYERRRDNEKSDSPNFKWTVAIPAIPPMHCATMYAGTSRHGGHIQGHRRT